MYKYKCPNCKRVEEQEEKTILKVCGCGYEMILIERRE